ncbi:hypothetical protein GCM10010233_24570 [Streptomyces pseudogriseolus]|uniref:Uncharacterized protein n=1 Tax=Streptomyces pseudogriseolus TaxID=36817 RepID=A0ABQ2TGM6_STREZ|nr:hypothetical protein GCM10010233_24570 [Streptomyces gancidicus]GGS69281.1 hypothetical protein GCM10010285_55480 [Streptomyces rubiginosus]
MHTSWVWRGGRELSGGASEPVHQLASVPGLYPLTGGSLSHNPHAANKAVGQHPGVDRKSKGEGAPCTLFRHSRRLFEEARGMREKGWREGVTKV